jgi:hypothetical protein
MKSRFFNLPDTDKPKVDYYDPDDEENSDVPSNFDFPE